MDLTTLASILSAIQQKEIDYGIDRDYCFVIDEDGYLVFLKRDRDVHMDIDGEKMSQWPVNSSDGEKIWYQETTENRGLRITTEFLGALSIKYLG